MFLDRKPIVYLWRPIYRTFFQGVIWPFFGRLKIFFFLETEETLNDIRNRTNAVEQQNRILIERLMALETEQRAQWNAIRTMLLCMLGVTYPHLGPNQKAVLKEEQETLKRAHVGS